MNLYFSSFTSCQKYGEVLFLFLLTGVLLFYSNHLMMPTILFIIG